MPKQNTHKPQKNSKTTTEVTDKPQKFQSLTVDNVYIVVGKSDPYKLASLKMFGSTYIKGFYTIPRHGSIFIAVVS